MKTQFTKATLIAMHDDAFSPNKKPLSAEEYKQEIEEKAARVRAITDSAALAEVKANYEAELAKADALLARAKHPVNPDSFASLKKFEAETILRACER